MTTEARLVLLHHVPPRRDQRRSAELLRQRAEKLDAMGAALGVELSSVDLASLTLLPVGDPELLEAFADAQVAWWCGQAAQLDDMDGLWTRIQRHLTPLPSLPKLLETPEVVEESYNLYRHYHRLQDAGIPQATTWFRSLSFEPMAHGIDEVSGFLRQLVDELAEELDLSQRLFFRTFYGTQKRSAYENASQSAEDLHEGLLVMIEALRPHQGIGGLAFRQWLPIASKIDDLLGDKFKREYRVFVVNGAPLYWCWNPGRLMAEATRLQKRAAQGSLEPLAPSDQERARWKELAAQVGGLLRSRLLAVDIAVLEDGSSVVLEVNPGHSSGWGHDAAYAGVYGPWLQSLVGLDATPPQELAEALSIELWGRGQVFDFFGD